MRQGREAWRGWASLLLMVASGFAGLGYQLIWTEQCALWLGHESAALLAVLTAFFGGLAAGGLALGPRIENSAHPARWYVGCELVIALWTLLLLFLAPPLRELALRAMGVQPSPAWHWSVAFGSTLLLFLPATAAMGATLPAIERLSRQWGQEQRSIAAHYTANTLGAVLGVLGVALVLIPAVGLARSSALCSGLNLLCAAIALAIFRDATPDDVRPQVTPDRRRARSAIAQLACTGLLGIGYEVLVVRVLSQVTEDTTYTFALLLAVYLVGSAAGAAAYARWLSKRLNQSETGAQLLAALAGACLLSAGTLWTADASQAWLSARLGGGMGAALAREAALALFAFALPTLCMGALFSHLSRAAKAAGISFGRAVGVNVLAASAAPLLFGVLAIPILGAKVTLLMIVIGYVTQLGQRAWSSHATRWTLAGVLATAVFAPPLTFVELPEGGHLVSYQEGPLAAVSVTEDADGVARLRINNRQQEGSSRTRKVDARQAWLPLLLHPAPLRALFLGLGTGVTASSAAEDPTLQVEAVELLPEVIAASAHFIGDTGGAARLHVVAADARRFVRTSERQFDVIVSDNFHPARSGSGALYTVEHFAAVRGRLERGGLFCQWLPLHQLDLDTLRSIVRAFMRVFPEGSALIASHSLATPVIGLLGRDAAARVDPLALRNRLSHWALSKQGSALGLEDELALLGSIVAGPEALQRFAANSPINSDDLPIVAYRAPRITYAPDSSPGDRLIALLQELWIEPGQLIAPSADASWPQRLTAYAAARDLFIVSGRDVRPSPRVEQMLARVRVPLFTVLRTSPEFRPAYDPLLAMAKALAQSDSAAARALLIDLARVQPARNEAPRLLAQLGGEVARVNVEPASE